MNEMTLILVLLGAVLLEILFIKKVSDKNKELQDALINADRKIKAMQTYTEVLEKKENEKSKLQKQIKTNPKSVVKSVVNSNNNKLQNNKQSTRTTGKTTKTGIKRAKK